MNNGAGSAKSRSMFEMAERYVPAGRELTEEDFSGCGGHQVVDTTKCFEGLPRENIFTKAAQQAQVYEGNQKATGGLKVETILQEAQRLVHGDRGESYGHPIDDFTRTGRMWAAILNVPHVSPQQVGLCMAAMKISRQCNKPKRDNMTDLAGYAETVQMCIDRLEIK